jgi:hypothetical protein
MQSPAQHAAVQHHDTVRCTISYRYHYYALVLVQVDKSKFADNDFDRQFLLGKTFGGGGGGGGGVGAEDVRNGTA